MSNQEIVKTISFDNIRQFDDSHQEFWSARDLQEVLGYDNWQNFQSAIERAKDTQLQSRKEENHFTNASKVIESGRWGQMTLVDYHLTRYAAYLVAMNGDPRKPEIAAAQTYFAVKTREAELRSTQPVMPQNYLEALKHWVASVEENQKLEQVNAELSPRAEAFDTLMDSSGLQLMRSVAKVLGTEQNRLFAFLWDQKTLMESNEPYQIYVDQKLFEVKLGTRVHPKTGESVATKTTYVTTKGVEYIRKRLVQTPPPTLETGKGRLSA